VPERQINALLFPEKSCDPNFHPFSNICSCKMQRPFVCRVYGLIGLPDMLGSRKTGNYLPNKGYPIYAYSGSFTAEINFLQTAPEFGTYRNRSCSFQLLPIRLSTGCFNTFSRENFQFSTFFQRKKC
jgi:hypothetical protein